LSTRSGTVAILGLVFPLALALGQQAPPASPVPAAAAPQVDCAGFITTDKISSDTFISDGANNDLESYLRQFTLGESVYLYSRRKASFSVGEQFSLVRPAKELFRTTRYNGEHWTLHSLGKPFEDVGRVTVTGLTPQGAVAELSFTCGPVYPGDIALPYQPRTIPAYVPTAFDRFALANGQLQGSIVAAKNNAQSLKLGDVVYLNFGQGKGARVGQLYRVYYVPPSSLRWAVMFSPPIPRETVGEVVILSALEKSSVAIIVNSTRDLSVGYGVELE